MIVIVNVIDYIDLSEPYVVQLGDGRAVDAIEKVTIQVDMLGLPCGILKVALAEVWCVPSLSHNLLSVPAVMARGNDVVFSRNGCTIYGSSGSDVGIADTLKDVSLYKLKCRPHSKQAIQDAGNAEGAESNVDAKKAADTSDQSNKEQRN